MVLVAISSFLFIVSILVALHCPFYRNTKKGIATFHWVICNWLSSTTWPNFRFVNYKSGLLISWLSGELLLGIATLLLIANATWNRFAGDVFKTAKERFNFLFFILLVDCIIIFTKNNITLNYVVITIVFLIFLQIISTNGIRSIRDWNILKLRKIGHESFFIDYRLPVNCLGRFGYLCLFCVNIRLLMVIIPNLREINFFVYIIYICSSLSSVLMFCIPAHLGGLIQVVKLQARYWSNKNLNSNNSLNIFNCNGDL